MLSWRVEAARASDGPCLAWRRRVKHAPMLQRIRGCPRRPGRPYSSTTTRLACHPCTTGSSRVTHSGSRRGKGMECGQVLYRVVGQQLSRERVWVEDSVTLAWMRERRENRGVGEARVASA